MPLRTGLRERRPTGSFDDIETGANRHPDKQEPDSTRGPAPRSCFREIKLVKSLNGVAGFIVSRIRVKVTAWRLTNTLVLLVFGVWKAVCAYKEAAAATTLDLALGLLWGLLAYWATMFEMERPQDWPGLFDRDVKTTLVRPLVAICIFCIIALPLYMSGFALVSFVQQRLTRNVSNEVALLIEQLVAFAWLLTVVALIALAAHLPFLKISYHFQRLATRFIWNHRDWNPSTISVETPKYLRRSAVLLLVLLYGAFCYVVTKAGMFSDLRKPAIAMPAYVLSIGLASFFFSFTVLYFLIGLIRMSVRVAKQELLGRGDVFLK